MFNFTTVVFDGTSPTFYFTNTSGWNTSSSNCRQCLLVFFFFSNLRWNRGTWTCEFEDSVLRPSDHEVNLRPSADKEKMWLPEWIRKCWTRASWDMRVMCWGSGPLVQTDSRAFASWTLCSLCSHRLEPPPRNKGARLRLQLSWCSGPYARYEGLTGSGVTDPLIHNLNTRWSWVFSFRPFSL